MHKHNERFKSTTITNNGLAPGWRSTLALLAILSVLATPVARADSKDDSEDKTDPGKAAVGGSPAAIQSGARPDGLNIVGPVMKAGSDAASQKFQSVLPKMLQFIKTYLPEAHNNLQSPLVFGIDPAKLTLATRSDVRAYFAYEGAGYHNTLGFNTTGTGTSSGDPKIIFPDASSSIGYGGTGTGVRSVSEPLLPGDFVNLGTYKAGTKLDFFLIANGAYGGNAVYDTTGGSNPDHINHVATFTPSYWGVANSPYLFISYEDLLGGGDKDFNDVIMAVDIGVASVKALLATPEPASWLVLGSLAGVASWTIRRRGRTTLSPGTAALA